MATKYAVSRQFPVACDFCFADRAFRTKTPPQPPASAGLEWQTLEAVVICDAMAGRRPGAPLDIH